MTTLDRYVLVAFVRNYAVSLVVLVGLLLVLDLVFNFDEFVVTQDAATASEVGGGLASAVTVLGRIVEYYTYQTFRVFGLIAGVIPVVAAAFTLLRMSRSNEMPAVLAAGVPLLRLAAPVVLAATVSNLVLLPINQEWIVPRLAERIVRERYAVVGASELVDLAGVEVNPVWDGQGRLLAHGRYHVGSRGGRGAWVSDFFVLETAAPFRPERQITATRADWDVDAGSWRLTEGRSERLTPTRGRAVPIDTYPGTITPERIALARSGEYVDLLSTRRINQLLADPTMSARVDLLRVKHARVAAWVVNVILVLLAIPAVLTRQPGELRHAAARCFVVVGACMAAVFVSQHLAGQPPADDRWAERWPAMMAWAPIFLFGPIAVWMLDRVES